MFGKIQQMLGTAWNKAGSFIKPLKNTVANGFDMLKNGAMKAGKFVYDNHEAIGNIVGGIGNILSNMPDSKIKQKLETGLGGATTAINRFSNLRPSNEQRKQFSNNITNRQAPAPNQQQSIQMKMNQQQQQQPTTQARSGQRSFII